MTMDDLETIEKTIREIERCRHTWKLEEKMEIDNSIAIFYKCRKCYGRRMIFEPRGVCHGSRR